MDYLIPALNEMSEILNFSGHTEQPARQEELAKAARIGSSTFVNLVHDRHFDSSLHLLSDRCRANRAAFTMVIGDVNHFLLHFLPLEEKILTESGASPIVVKVLKAEAARLQNCLSLVNPDVNANAVKIHLSAMRDITIGIAVSLEQNRVEEAEKRAISKKLVMAAMAIGGAAMIALNAVTTLLSPAGSAASGVIGAEMLSANLIKILNDKP